MKRKLFQTLVNGRIVILVACQASTYKLSLNTEIKDIVNVCYIYPEMPSQTVSADDISKSWDKLGSSIEKWATKINCVMGGY